jgi:hypothetical protein
MLEVAAFSVVHLMIGTLALFLLRDSRAILEQPSSLFFGTKIKTKPVSLVTAMVKDVQRGESDKREKERRRS